GKSTPDWQGAFGLSATILRNFELSGRFEFKFGNYMITNLTDAFRQANPVIGRNLQKSAQVEATLMNPASTPEQRLAAARTWAYELKALSPYDGLNQNQNGAFLRFRELSLTYNVPTQWAERRFGLRYLSLTLAARNLALWTPYRGIDPELNEYGRGGASADLGGIDQNFGQGIDAFGFALPRRISLARRLRHRAALPVRRGQHPQEPGRPGPVLPVRRHRLHDDRRQLQQLPDRLRPPAGGAAGGTRQHVSGL